MADLEYYTRQKLWLILLRMCSRFSGIIEGEGIVGKERAWARALAQQHRRHQHASEVRMVADLKCYRVRANTGKHPEIIYWGPFLLLQVCLDCNLKAKRVWLWEILTLGVKCSDLCVGENPSNKDNGIAEDRRQPSKSFTAKVRRNPKGQRALVARAKGCFTGY